MKILTQGKYYGSQDVEVSFNGILLSRYNYTVDQTDWHYHENPYFMFVLHGDMMDCNSRAKTLCPAGSLMFNNWQETHYGAKHSRKAAGFHLELEKSLFKKNGIHMTEGSQLIESPEIHFLFAKMYREFVFFDSYSQVSIEVLVMQISEVLGTVNQSNYKSTPNWIYKLKELLHDDSSDLSLQSLSDQLGVHPVHISRAVPKFLSTGLGAYIRQLKLKKAIPLLLDSKYSLTQIAHQSGFVDQSHFNRVFKSYFNMNPGLYRRNLNKNKQC